MKLGVIGAGAWGTALAQVAAASGAETLLWAREADVVGAINSHHENSLFLPGVRLSDMIRATSALEDLQPCDALLVVTPAQHMRAVLSQMTVGTRPLILCAKGIEAETQCLMSEVARQVCPDAPIAVLSGPTFAHEVAKGLPTAITLACEDDGLGRQLAERIAQPAFRPYIATDVIGAEIGGAVKNVLAIACGLVDGAGRKVSGADAQGVLEVHCATRMNGYQNRPELTAERLRDGWIHTGDIMRRDADGWYYFVGRADDMFVCAGENVYPGEVERLLERHPDVLEACVLPMDDAVRGQVPVAFVVPRPGTAPTAQALKDHVIAHAAPHLYPRRVWFIERMPLAGTNKIDRHALTARAAELAKEPTP